MRIMTIMDSKSVEMAEFGFLEQAIIVQANSIQKTKASVEKILVTKKA